MSVCVCVGRKVTAKGIACRISGYSTRAPDKERDRKCAAQSCEKAAERARISKSEIQWAG